MKLPFFHAKTLVIIRLNAYLWRVFRKIIMEDFLQFLVIIGVIVIGIIRQANKNKAGKQPDATPRIPSGQEKETMETRPIFPTNGEQWFPTQTFPAHRTESSEIKVSKIRKQKTFKQSTSPPPEKRIDEIQEVSRQPEIGENDFSLSSAEDARKAIIWSEILRRKY